MKSYCELVHWYFLTVSLSIKKKHFITQKKVKFKVKSFIWQNFFFQKYCNLKSSYFLPFIKRLLHNFGLNDERTLFYLKIRKMKEIWTEKKFLTKNNFFKKFVVKYIPY